MRQPLLLHTAIIASLLSPDLLFWKRNTGDEEREAVFNTVYDVVADLYASAASLKPRWSDDWQERHRIKLPPKFEQDEMLPERTVRAAQEMRFARMLLQRNRWRSVRQPLFEEVDHGAWASLQRNLQIVPANLLTIREEHIEYIRLDEIEWLERAIEGFDNARTYLRTADRAGEPLDRQVANSAYVSVHTSLQLSDRFIERQRFELTGDV